MNVRLGKVNELLRAVGLVLVVATSDIDDATELHLMTFTKYRRWYFGMSA